MKTKKGSVDSSTGPESSRGAAGTTAKLLLTVASIGATLIGWLSLSAGDAQPASADTRRPGTPLPPLPTLGDVSEPAVRFVPPLQRAAARPKPVATTRSSR